jgi:uncharacterized protein
MDKAAVHDYARSMTFSEREELVRRIRGAIDARKIVLFGSRARGDAKPESDADVLVVAESVLPRYRRASPIYAAVADLPFEVEALVFTQAEVDDWSSVPESLVATALREGIVLYEAEA